jgi:hypothetical protein
MNRKRFICFFVFAAIMLFGGQALAADCSSCVECSADPTFTQRDARNPAILPLLRNYATTEIQKEGVTAVVVLSDGGCGCDTEASGEAEEPQRTVVLVGDQGARTSFEVTGDLPAEVRAIVPADD